VKPRLAVCGVYTESEVYMCRGMAPEYLCNWDHPDINSGHHRVSVIN